MASTSEKRTDQVFQRCRQGRKFDFDLLERKRCRWRLRFQSRSRNCNFRLFNKSINYFNSDKSRVFTSAIFFCFCFEIFIFQLFSFSYSGKRQRTSKRTSKADFYFFEAPEFEKKDLCCKNVIEKIVKSDFF